MKHSLPIVNITDSPRNADYYFSVEAIRYLNFTRDEVVILSDLGGYYIREATLDDNKTFKMRNIPPRKYTTRGQEVKYYNVYARTIRGPKMPLGQYFLSKEGDKFYLCKEEEDFE